MNVQLGSNDFFGVPFPLVLADRFFHIYSDAGRFNLDVFRWDEEAEEAVYEVLAGQPQSESITTNPTGIVTFSRPDEGTFLYKFRPKPGISQIFGRVPVDSELAVRITDRGIAVMNGDVVICTVGRSQFTGMPIGIEVGADGSVGIGVNRVPEGMVLVRRSA